MDVPPLAAGFGDARLYLASFRLGPVPGRFVELCGGRGARVAVVAAALDDEPAAVRSDGRAREVAALEGLGLVVTDLDLRGGSEQSSRAVLAGVDGIWVRGGNVFVLRAAMRRRGLDDVLLDLLARDALAYGGYSAGPCVLAPSLRGLERCDDATSPTASIGGEVVWDGLGVLGSAVVPHLDSPGHPETSRLTAVAAGYRESGTPWCGLRDDEAFVTGRDRLERVGPADVVG